MLTVAILLACVAAPSVGVVESAPALASADSATADSAAKAKPSRIYYGGGIGFSISSQITQISLQPHVGYKLNKKTSIGASVRYEYFKDERYIPTAESQSYGGGIFSRHRFHKQVYGQAELSFTHYDWSGGLGGSSNVPFFLLGGGYAQPLSPNTFLTVDVMYDLIQDPESPYRDGSPRITTGITANF
jgi:hypothetical protein